MKTINEIFEYDPTIPSCIRRNGKIVSSPRVFVKRTSTPIPSTYLRQEEIVWILFGNKIKEGCRVVKKSRNCKPTIENLQEIVIKESQGNVDLSFFLPSTKVKSGLIWSKHRLSPSGNVTVYPDDVAGTLDGRKYYSINLNGKSHKIHRLLWEIYFGPIKDGYVIDHIDGNKQNNSINNLRCILPNKNARNAKHPRKSESGTIGVHTCKRNGELFGYRVGWQDWSTGKPKGMLKYFYFKEHGDSAFDKACEFRQNKISELNSLGYGYTTRHGYKETNHEDSN